MIRLAANLDMLFAEQQLAARIDCAAEAGFKAVEFQFPYVWDVAEIARRTRAHALDVVLINAPAGERSSGDAGLAGLPGRGAAFRDSIKVAIETAHRLECPQIHVMAGRRDPNSNLEDQRSLLVENLGWALEQIPAAGMTMLLEPLNTRLAPDYLLTDLNAAKAAIEAVGDPRLRLQFDLFHLQIMGGDLINRFAEVRDLVGHVQLAGVPGRHEPDEGELAVLNILQAFDRLGYTGWYGCEYTPRGTTRAGLAWAEPFGISARLHS